MPGSTSGTALALVEIPPGIDPTLTMVLTPIWQTINNMMQLMINQQSTGYTGDIVIYQVSNTITITVVSGLITNVTIA